MVKMILSKEKILLTLAIFFIVICIVILTFSYIILIVGVIRFKYRKEAYTTISDILNGSTKKSDQLYSHRNMILNCTDKKRKNKLLNIYPTCSVTRFPRTCYFTVAMQLLCSRTDFVEFLLTKNPPDVCVLYYLLQDFALKALKNEDVIFIDFYIHIFLSFYSDKIGLNIGINSDPLYIYHMCDRILQEEFHETIIEGSTETVEYLFTKVFQPFENGNRYSFFFYTSEYSNKNISDYLNVITSSENDKKHPLIDKDLPYILFHDNRKYGKKNENAIFLESFEVEDMTYKFKIGARYFYDILGWHYTLIYLKDKEYYENDGLLTCKLDEKDRDKILSDEVVLYMYEKNF